MTVLVTGATGFIGRRLVTALADAGHRVVAASRAGTPVAGAAAVPLDLADPATFTGLPSAVETVVHLAALIDVRADNLDTARAINVAGTGRLVDYAAAAGARRFVHGSTGGVYGSGPVPFGEATPPRPVDRYGMTKAQAELEVSARAEPEVRVLLRYAFPYALGTPNPIDGIARSVANGRPIRVRADGGPRFNPIHVDDAVRMTVAACALDESATLNVAGREPTSFTEVATLLGDALGRRPVLDPVGPEALIPYYRADALCAWERGAAALGASTVPLAAGLAAMAAELMAAGSTVG